MAYNKSDVVESETAYKVLRELYKNDNGSYPSEISSNISAHSSTVSDLLKNLREMGIVKRGKRTKAQYYIISYNGFQKYLFKYWNDIQSSIDLESVFNQIKDEFDEDISEKQFVEGYRQDLNQYNNTEASLLIQKYISNYVQKNENSTIFKMIYSDLALGIMTGEIGLLSSNATEDIDVMTNQIRAIYLISNFDTVDSFRKANSEIEACLDNMMPENQYYTNNFSKKEIKKLEECMNI